MTEGLALGEAVGDSVRDLMGLAVDEPSAKEPVTWWVHWLGVISIKISSNTPSAGTMTVVSSYSTMKPPEEAYTFHNVDSVDPAGTAVEYLLSVTIHI
jgi:hypothetical protein